MNNSNKTEIRVKKSKAKTLPTGWRSMRSAPRDGTMILVCETPNGQNWNVMPASYQLHQGNALMEGFWGASPTSMLPMHLQQRDHLVSERGLPVGFKAIAMTPLCWRPTPECEPVEKLRRRASQVYAAKERARKKAESTLPGKGHPYPAQQDNS